MIQRDVTPAKKKRNPLTVVLAMLKLIRLKACKEDVGVALKVKTENWMDVSWRGCICMLSV